MSVEQILAALNTLRSHTMTAKEQKVYYALLKKLATCAKTA